MQSAGPGGALAAYACIGIMVYFLMTSLGGNGDIYACVGILFHLCHTLC
ncbi:hypothetical protein RCO48_23190 [Peribacillus frigoritolerans]|nr:hypothetical protein [Peribacillus frigoritolerans]